MKTIENINGIEDQLLLKLKSYQPNPIFVEKLKNRLADREGVEVETSWKIPRVFIFSAGIIGFLAASLWLVFYIMSFFRESNSGD